LGLDCREHSAQRRVICITNKLSRREPARSWNGQDWAGSVGDKVLSSCVDKVGDRVDRPRVSGHTHDDQVHAVILGEAQNMISRWRAGRDEILRTISEFGVLRDQIADLSHNGVGMANGIGCRRTDSILDMH
jgi:hypothetical protein